MVFSWMIIFGFVVFCFTVILREGEKVKKVKEEPFEEREEIT